MKNTSFSFCLSACQSVCLPVSVFVCLSTYLSLLCLSTHLSVSSSVCLFCVRPSGRGDIGSWRHRVVKTSGHGDIGS